VATVGIASASQVISRRSSACCVTLRSASNCLERILTVIIGWCSLRVLGIVVYAQELIRGASA